MVFYSYEFLKSKVQQIDYIQLGLTLFVIVILAIALYRYFKNKQDTKFRELALIAVIGILILAGSKIQKTNILEHFASSKQLLKVYTLIKKISILTQKPQRMEPS